MNRILIPKNNFGKNLLKFFLDSCSTKNLNGQTKKYASNNLIIANYSVFKNNFLTNETPCEFSQTRSLSKKTSKDKTISREAEDENDDELEDDDDDESYLKLIDTTDFKPGFKLLAKHVASLRVDSILAAGLNTSRKKIDDNFYLGKLRLNGEKVLKKSLTVKESDRVDMIGDADEKTGKRTLKRVFLSKVLNETSKKNKPKVVLIVWKSGLFEEDAFKDINEH